MGNQHRQDIHGGEINCRSQERDSISHTRYLTVDKSCSNKWGTKYVRTDDVISTSNMIGLIGLSHGLVQAHHNVMSPVVIEIKNVNISVWPIACMSQFVGGSEPHKSRTNAFLSTWISCAYNYVKTFSNLWQPGHNSIIMVVFLKDGHHLWIVSLRRGNNLWFNGRFGYTHNNHPDAQHTYC